MKALYVRDGRGRYRKAPMGDIVDNAIDIVRKVFAEQLDATTLSSPADAVKFLTPYMSTLKREHFLAVFLNNRNRVVGIKEMHMGTIYGVHVHPREVARAALEHNAASIVVVHNHPSGATSPSKGDIDITGRLRSALDVLDITLLDHIIIAGGNHHSMADAGEL